jgi:hypothetical protein
MAPWYVLEPIDPLCDFGVHRRAHFRVMRPSESFMTSVGSSTPRLRSIKDDQRAESQLHERVG